MANQTINRPTISRSTGVGGGGGEILPPPPPGLGEGTGGVGATMSLLPEDPPTISSTFARGAEGGNPWSRGGVGGGGGAFAAPPSSSGGLHSGGPYRGPTIPAPGSGLGQPRYQQDQQDYGGGNAFAPPFYPSPQPMEGVSPPRRMWQNQGPVPTSFKPAPPTSLARQSSGNVVEVQEVPSSYRQSPSYDPGGEGDALPPYAMHPHAQQQGYQLDGQYHSQHQQQVGPMGSIGQYSSNHHLQYPSSSPQRPYSRSSSRSYQSSSGPSPSRGGRGRGAGGGRGRGGGAGRGRGGGGGRGGQARPLSRNSSQGASIRTPSPALSELEVFSSPSRQQRPDSAASDTCRSPRTPRPSSVSSHGSNSSGGSRRSGGRRSGGRVRISRISKYHLLQFLTLRVCRPHLISYLDLLLIPLHLTTLLFYNHSQRVGAIVEIVLNRRPLKIFEVIHFASPRLRRSCAATSCRVESASMPTNAIMPMERTTSNSRHYWNWITVESPMLKFTAPEFASRGWQQDRGE